MEVHALNPTEQSPYSLILARMMRTCSRREMCSEQIRRKLKDLPLQDEEKESIVQKLIENRFVDDRRFVEIYCRDKSLRAQWGWFKIRDNLRNLKLLPYETLARELCSPQETAKSTLSELALRKWNQICTQKEGLSLRQRRSHCARLSRFLLGRGFAPEEVTEAVSPYFKEP